MTNWLNDCFTFSGKTELDEPLFNMVAQEYDLYGWIRPRTFLGGEAAAERSPDGAPFALVVYDISNPIPPEGPPIAFPLFDGDEVYPRLIREAMDRPNGPYGYRRYPNLAAAGVEKHWDADEFTLPADLFRGRTEDEDLRKYAEVATYRIRLAYLDESPDSLTFTDVLLTQKEILTLFLQLHGNAEYGTTTVVDEGTAHEVRAEKPFWLHVQKP